MSALRTLVTLYLSTAFHAVLTSALELAEYVSVEITTKDCTSDCLVIANPDFNLALYGYDKDTPDGSPASRLSTQSYTRSSVPFTVNVSIPTNAYDLIGVLSNNTAATFYVLISWDVDNSGDPCKGNATVDINSSEKRVLYLSCPPLTAQDNNINALITWCYVSIQVGMAFFISILGVVHVYRCIMEEKKKAALKRSIAGNTKQPVDAKEVKLASANTVTESEADDAKRAEENGETEEQESTKRTIEAGAIMKDDNVTYVDGAEQGKQSEHIHDEPAEDEKEQALSVSEEKAETEEQEEPNKRSSDAQDITNDDEHDDAKQDSNGKEGTDRTEETQAEHGSSRDETEQGDTKPDVVEQEEAKIELTQKSKAVEATIDDIDEQEEIQLYEAASEYEELTCFSLFKLWCRTIWKMRSVYGGLAVHSFDVLTDILVIVQWWLLARKDNSYHRNIDPQIMAYAGIAVLSVSKIISTVAIILKERNIRRAILQLFDLLIFEEIFESHRKIVSQFKNRQSLQSKHAAIESTLSFKYIRMFEAVFESIPQSVLQLVFIVRIDSRAGKYDPIFMISITQSIISMTNSILNNDYTKMQDEKWKRYKQRLPPTPEFLKHAICRLSEVTYRIGLLALFWTVCEGLALSIMLGCELILFLSITVYLIKKRWRELRTDTFLAAISSLIVTSSEEVYSGDLTMNHLCCYFDSNWSLFCLFTLGNVCCCFGLSAILTSIATAIRDKELFIFFQPTMRIAVSITEIIILIFYGLFAANGERKEFLLGPDHGLWVLVVTCMCLLIYSQFGILFPDFSLPLYVSARSKWAYAYCNELSELEKIKVRFPKTVDDGYDDDGNKVYRQTTQEDIARLTAEFWDEKRGSCSAAVFAIANGNHDIVQWLEERGAVAHKGLQLTKLTAKWRLQLYDNTKWFKVALHSDEWAITNLVWINTFKIKGALPKQGYKMIDGRKYVMKSAADFWDEPLAFVDDQPVTAAMFAIAKQDKKVLKWLEDHGATKHRGVSEDTAKYLLQALQFGAYLNHDSDTEHMV